jgi:fructose-1,6-bisphosphatase I
MTVIKAQKLTTIERFVIEQEILYPDATGSFTNLMHDLTFAMRMISMEVRRAGINDILGLTKSMNIHGEQVRKIDQYANEAILSCMVRSGNLCAMASEEEDELIPIGEDYDNGKYVLLFDPLDGSTNIDVNITIGTIFSIYKRIDPESEEPGNEFDVLQPGYKQAAAGYVLYGSSTVFVYTTGHGVHVFTYDPMIGEFLLINESLKIPKRGQSYSVNEGYYFKWAKNIQEYLKYLKTPNEEGTKPYTLRYVATAAADIHRVITYGGIYMYPPTPRYTEGKIRLSYEANPLAMIVEQAGGKAVTGKGRIMDITPHSIHQRVPIYMGSPDDVDDLESFLRDEHPFQTEKK